MYQLNVKVTNTGLTVSKVTLTDWVIDTTLPDPEFKPVVTPSTPSGPAIDATGKANGVYAVSSTGSLIDYNSADASALGVALVVGEHKFMIAKSDATDGTNSILYWTKSYSDLSLTDYINADDTNSFGSFDGPSTRQLNKDFTTWTAGALSDFNGKSNTAVIIADYAALGKDMDSRDMCKVLETYNEGGYADWYVPACGQLALMYLNITDINAALTKIGGTALAAWEFFRQRLGRVLRRWRCQHGL